MAANKPQERKARVEKYTSIVHGTTLLTEKTALKYLKEKLRDHPAIPAAGKRRIDNFKLLEKINFRISRPGKTSFAWSANKQIRRNSLPYKMFLEYAKTDYGSMMIAAVLRDNKKPGNNFEIAKGGPQAAGNENIMFLPDDFGTTPTNGTKLRFGIENDGQPVDLLAIIHHEFHHTKFWRKSVHQSESIQKERLAVLENENPVRIINGFEPRYTYYYSDSKSTINIADEKVIRGGKHDVHYADITKLVPRGDKDSLYKHAK